MEWKGEGNLRKRSGKAMGWLRSCEEEGNQRAEFGRGWVGREFGNGEVGDGIWEGGRQDDGRMIVSRDRER